MQSTLREGFGFRITLTRGSADVIFLQQAAIGESNVSKRVIRVLVGCLLKLIDRFLDVLRSPLIPVVATSQVELIRFRVACVALYKPLLLLTCWLQAQFLSYFAHQRLLYGKHVHEPPLVFLAPELSARDGIN